MRTVEQVQKELTACRRELETAAAKVKTLEEEMRGIYNAAKEALGIDDEYSVTKPGHPFIQSGGIVKTSGGILMNEMG